MCHFPFNNFGFPPGPSIPKNISHTLTPPPSTNSPWNWKWMAPLSCSEPWSSVPCPQIPPQRRFQEVKVRLLTALPGPSRWASSTRPPHPHRRRPLTGGICAFADAAVEPRHVAKAPAAAIGCSVRGRWVDGGRPKTGRGLPGSGDVSYIMHVFGAIAGHLGGTAVP